MDHARGVYLIMLPGQHQCQVLGRHASRQTCLHVGCILVCVSLLLILNKCCRSSYPMGAIGAKFNRRIVYCGMFLVDSWEASRPVVFYGSKSGLIGDVIVWFTSVLRL